MGSREARGGTVTAPGPAPWRRAEPGWARGGAAWGAHLDLRATWDPLSRVTALFALLPGADGFRGRAGSAHA